MAPTSPHRYQTHFYCALCGAPFAQVYRTATTPVNLSAKGPALDPESPTEESEDVDVANGFNIAETDNTEIPPEVWQNNMSDGAARERAARLRAAAKQQGDRARITTRPVSKAYDGRLISVKDMEWCRELRAIIHSHAFFHPQGHGQVLEVGRMTYLTGRGIIREYDGLAKAYASIDFDEHTDPSNPSRYPQFPPHGNHEFHLYQENRAQYLATSMPFHEECYSLLHTALEATAADAGWTGSIYDEEDGQEPFDSDQIYLWLREFLGGEPDGKKVNYNAKHLVAGDSRREVMTRLGEINYREAQTSGEGWKWRHEDGLHWLLADPSSPVEKLSVPAPYREPKDSRRFPVGKGNGPDIFGEMPPEIIFMIFQHLDHPSDFFAFRHASPAVAMCPVSGVHYKPFVRTEFRHLRKLIERLDEEGRERRYDWKETYHQLRRLLYAPDSSSPPEAWAGTDINLLNRCRIWKIVKPIAEYIFHTSAIGIQVRHNAYPSTAERTSVPRGLLGLHSGKRGSVESVFFGNTQGAIKLANSDGVANPKIVRDIRVWTHGKTGELTGIGFNFKPDVYWEKLGSIGAIHEDIHLVRTKNLAGFVACFNGKTISGIQIVFTGGALSARFGKWDNPAIRRFIPPPDYRNLNGVIGFVTAEGLIETFGVLEEAKPNVVIQVPGFPPKRNPVYHETETAWKELPPQPHGIMFRERIGPCVKKWRTMPAECEIWDSSLRDPAPPRHRTSEHLIRIEGFYDDEYLRGLCFHYDSGHKSGMGSLDEKKWNRQSFNVQPSEKFTAAVISEDNGGIRGCMFVTTMSRTSPYFGPRYKGNHRANNTLVSAPQSEAIHEYVNSPIIGLSAIYDYDNDRFLQLGVAQFKSDDQHTAPRSNISVPFSIHAGKDGCALWEDEVLPKNYANGCRNLRTNKGDARARFAGWIKLNGLRRVEVYGAMKGIRFVYWNNKEKEKYFGLCEGTKHVQEFERGAIIDGIVEVKGDKADVKRKRPVQTVKRILFLSGRHDSASRRAIIQKADSVIESKHLFAVKFLFSCDRLHYWSPIYDFPSHISLQERRRLTCPWKLFGDKDFFCAEIAEPCERVAFAFLQDVDAIKGYVRNSGSLCGIAFRRKGKWDAEIFGDPSGLEVPLLLRKEEQLTSMMVSMQKPEQHTGMQTYTPKDALPVAIAFSTSEGRITPWLGDPSGETKQLLPPPNSTCVGICAELDVHDPLFKKFGLICQPPTVGEPQRRFSEEAKPIPLIPRNLHLGAPKGHGNAAAWSWLVDPANLIKQGCQLGMLSRLGNRNLSGESTATDYKPQRTYNIYDPALLQQVVIFSNHSFRFGIKGISLHGKDPMGTVYFGAVDNPGEVDEEAVSEMEINGPGGERIKEIQTMFRTDGNDKYIVGLCIETNWGRSQDLLASGAVVDEARAEEEVGVLKAEAGECVGFHTVLNKFNFFDLGMITVPPIHPATPDKPSPRKTAKATESSTPHSATASSSKLAHKNSPKRIDPFELYKSTWNKQARA